MWQQHLQATGECGSVWHMANESPNVKLIGSAEVCTRLDIDRSTLIRRCQLGRISYVTKLPGPRGQYLFDPVYINRLVIDQAAAAQQAAS